MVRAPPAMGSEMAPVATPGSGGSGRDARDGNFAQNPPAMQARASAVVIRRYASTSSPERKRAARAAAT
jgi:hypothetical protein